MPWVRQARASLGETTWVDSNANNAVTETPARLAQARASADQSIVLLKNSPVNGSALLPLKVPASGPYKVAVVGYYANPSGGLFLGGYSSIQGAAGQAKEVNAYQGIKAAVQAINPTPPSTTCPASPAGRPGRR